MKAMLLHKITDLKKDRHPLMLTEVQEPVIHDHEILIRVSACGICHTELDEIEGRTPPPVFPVIPGHQVVGQVVGNGQKARKFTSGDRVGVAWIYSACGTCEYCRKGLDNLCPEFMATGRDIHGGYAEFMKAHENFAYAIPESFSDQEAAPLFCAGAIGYRSLKLTGITNGQILGLTGFGASGHLVLKLSKFLYPGTPVFVFARSASEREFAMEIGADWAGDTHDKAPDLLHAIIDTTPVWYPAIAGLANLKPSGRLVINAIRKEDYDKKHLLSLDYTEHLWMEKEIKSVANVSSQDVAEFLNIASKARIKPEVELYALSEANKALVELKEGRIKGAKVLMPG